VSEYESAHSLPPLYGYSGGITIEEPELDEPMEFTGKPIIHTHLLSATELDILATKAHLVVRMIQDRVGQELFLQVLIVTDAYIQYKLKKVLLIILLVFFVEGCI